jgi:hypothetical protein
MNERLTRRVAALEAKTTPAEPPPTTWVQIIVQPDETEEEVKARYTAEHPEMPTSVCWLIRKIVPWPRRSADCLQERDATDPPSARACDLGGRLGRSPRWASTRVPSART